jgi:hypothetical protein
VDGLREIAMLSIRLVTVIRRRIGCIGRP